MLTWLEWNWVFRFNEVWHPYTSNLKT